MEEGGGLLATGPDMEKTDAVGGQDLYKYVCSHAGIVGFLTLISDGADQGQLLASRRGEWGEMTLQIGHQLLEYHAVPLPSAPLPAPGDSLCPQEKLTGLSLKVSFLLL